MNPIDPENQPLCRSPPQVALKKAVSQQPVSVAIQADQRAFQLYMGGVFDDKECGTALDHGVLVGAPWGWRGEGGRGPARGGQGAGAFSSSVLVWRSWG